MNRGMKLLIGVGICLFSQSVFSEHSLAPERRRPLQRLRNFLRGTDISVRHGGGSASACQSTPVAKKELDSGLCRVAYFTAAHCVDSSFESIVIDGLGQIPRSKMKVTIPGIYFEDGGSQSRTPNAGDSATLVFDIDCDQAKNVTPVPLARVDSNGVTQVGNHVYLQKRQGEAPGNRGQGAQILADVVGQDSKMFNFKVPSPQGYAIVGGDSGGPIFNESGQLVCPISGSSYEYQRETGQLRRTPDGTPDAPLDPFTVVCDKRAIARLRSTLAQFGLDSSESLGPSSSGTLAQRPQSGGQNSSPAQPPRQSQLQPQAQAQNPGSGSAGRQSSSSGFNGYQFRGASSGSSRGLHFLKEGETPSLNNAIYLKRMPDGTRRAAIKGPDGQAVILGDEVQEGLRQYYEAHQEKLEKLNPEKRAFVDGFLNSFASNDGNAGEQNPEDSSQQAPDQASGQAHGKNPSPQRDRASIVSEFECVSSQGGFRPKKSGGNFKLLGASVFKDKSQCEKAVSNARNGAVCSATGIGFKPTHFSGSVPTRKDYGYLGGSSMSFDDCLKTTLNSNDKAICYWGGSDWYSGDINGTGVKTGLPRGPFRSVDECNQAINEGQPLQDPSKPQLANNQRNIQDEKPDSETPDSAQDKPNSQQDFASTHAVYGTHCASCHSDGKQKVNIPSWATDLGELEKRLASSDPRTQGEAQKWVDKLHQVLVEQNNMPPTQTAREKMEKDPEVKALREFLTEHAKGKSQRSPSSQTRAANATQILSPEKLSQYRAMLGKLNIPDSEITALLKDSSTLIYDDKSMPAGYQDTSNPVVGFRPSGHTTFAEGAPFLDEKNRLRLFTKGVGMSADAESFHLLALPKDENGNLKPVEYWTQKDPKNDGMMYRWKFPEGTVSMEAVVQRDSKGNPHIVELRTRKKDSFSDQAEVNIFSAAPSKESLEQRLAEIEKSNPTLAAEARQIQAQLGSLPLERVGIDNGQYRERFGRQGHTATLPKMSEPLVKELLSEFESARGTSWDNQGGQTAFAPTSDQQFGIVPFHSNRGAMPVDRQSCNTCHDKTNSPIRDAFHYDSATGAFKQHLNNTTYLYGNFPGDDGNLRFHIFDPGPMPVFGRDGLGDNRRVNPALAPILRRVNPGSSFSRR